MRAASGKFQAMRGKVEILPAILAKDEKEFRRKVESVAGVCDMVQIDVMDGKFVENITWAEPGRIGLMRLTVEFEAHLMVNNPLSVLEAWSAAGCVRALLHAEALENPAEVLKEARLYGMEVGLALNPETPLASVEDALAGADVVQIMGVHPGRMGQPFESAALEKVKALRKQFPDLLIEVDGGVAVGIARQLADAGANRLVSGSAVFNSGSPAKALEALRQDVELK